MAAVRLMRCPHHYLSRVPAAADGGELGYDRRKRKHPLRDLYEAEDYESKDEWEHKAVSKATLVATEQLIRAAERDEQLRGPKMSKPIPARSGTTWCSHHLEKTS